MRNRTKYSRSVYYREPNEKKRISQVDLKTWIKFFIFVYHWSWLLQLLTSHRII